jgi:SPP1 gp7 family putative phage head morphogenesis protein
MPTNNKYWQDRFNKLQTTQMNKGSTYFKGLEKQYAEAVKSIEKDMSVWYKRFADNNQITLVDAQKMLSGNYLKEFQWDVHEYIKYGEMNALDPKWMKELENASARVHLSRLEALKIQTQHSIEKLYGSQLPGMTALTKEIYSDGFYHTAFELQKGFNVGYDIHKFNNTQLEQIISKPWAADAKTFSDRIWTSKRTLINTLHTEMTQSIIRGESPAKAISTIAAKLGVDKSKAGRLVMTETAFFASTAQKDAFNKLGVEEFEVVATLDLKTSAICQDLDGHVFPMKDFMPGTTAPPFHCWCRSVTAPYFDDLGGERIARGADGNTYHIPSNIKYEDWHKTFVDPLSQKGVIIKHTPIIPVLTFNDKIQTIRNAIANNGGVITETDLQSAGKIIQDDLSASRIERLREVDALKAEYDATGINDIEERLNKIRGARRGLFTPEELGFNNQLEMSLKYDELMHEKFNVQVKAEEIRKKMDQAKAKYHGNAEDNAKELKDKLSEIRSVGNGSNNVDVHLNKSRSPMRTVVKNAYDYYPTDWVDTSTKYGTLTPKKVDRGFYSHYGSEIAISGYNDKSMMETAIHELGHRFERTITGVLDAEKIFYNRRTAGESLQWLGGSYSYSEKSRFDKFLDTYMGKDYGGSAYELVSMGFQHAYLNPTKLWKDEDFATWIYGILALL